jgi:hypothetical protein
MMKGAGSRFDPASFTSRRPPSEPFSDRSRIYRRLPINRVNRPKKARASPSPNAAAATK